MPSAKQSLCVLVNEIATIQLPFNVKDSSKETMTETTMT